MRKLGTLLVVIMTLMGCGRSGESDDNSESACCDEFEDIRGAVIPANADGTSLDSWVLLLIERDTGTARASVLGAGGLFNFRNVKTNVAHTMVLLGSDYILKSVASFPSEETGAVHQFFQLNKRYIGNVLYDGPVLSLQTPENVDLESNLAKDAAGDGLPNGTVQLGAKTLLEGDTPELPFNIDYIDSDYDGLINSFDLDDDDDGIPDFADTDSNGDDIEDSLQSASDLHFAEGVKNVSIQYELSKTTGTNKAFLTFTANLRDDVDPFAVQLLGPSRLIEGANIETVDNTGAPIDLAWNRRLDDDGDSQDELPNDRIFAKKVRLPLASLRPKANETFLIQLLMGEEENPWHYTFPIVFPSISVGTITAAMDDGGVVTMSGQPFGTLTEFEWTVALFDTDDIFQWRSQSIDGSKTTFTVPPEQLASGETYKVSISARLPDRVSGYPGFLVHSASTSVKIP